MKFLLRWSVFIKERFNPITNTPVILAYFASNVLFLFICYGKSVAWFPLFSGFLLVWLIFFHMRLFDDIKDYETDRLYNKERPLPRGLITIKEYGAVTLICIILEIVIALWFGQEVFSTYTLVLSFTLLMRQEFFIGEWLRPRMELYAASHTLSAFLMGVLIISLASGKMIWQMPISAVLFSLGSWFVFNVFEFGRKTFSKEEEREGIDSYSLRLKPWGAFGLITINMLTATIMMMLAVGKLVDIKQLMYIIIVKSVLVFLVSLTGLAYCIKGSLKYARLYRSAVSLYLLLYYVVFILMYFVR